MASLPGYRPRPGRVRTRDHLPPLGERHGQLPALDLCVGAGRGRGRYPTTSASTWITSSTPPSDRRAEYDRFIWLVEVIKQARCDDAVLHRTSPFLAKDVLASAILVRANEALVDVAEVVGAPEEERTMIRAWIERGRGGLDERWDPGLGLCLDYDLRAGEPLVARTIAGFAPIIAGTGNIDRLEKGLRVLESHTFTGNPDLRRPLPPSTSPDDLGFLPRNYWRGPIWPVMNWLLWWSLESSGQRKRAAWLKDHAVAQLSDGRFGEYYEPFTGEALGSDEQSWTAAVALDWLADGESPLPAL